MTIITPESRALLKRMDADDAIERAALLGIEAAAQWHDEKAKANEEAGRTVQAVFHESAAVQIRALKAQK